MIEIPGYKIHREIDNSDYCHSYSAIQLSSGKTMVVSVFSHEATQYISFQSFFNNIEQKLAHKVFGVISPIKEFIKTPNHTYIISDLLSNSCRQAYKERQTDIETIFNQIYKIALSLDLYHQVDFYHGGISLDNLFHDSENNLTLGLAAFNQNFSNEEDINIDLETESYKAPEKEVSLSKSRDFYALGVVLYELIFKQKPFITHSLEQQNALKNAAVIKIPDKNLNYLKPVFTALLHPNPDKRIATASKFKDILSTLGIQLKEMNFSITPLELSKNQVTDIPRKQVTRPSSRYIYYGAGISIVLILSYIFMSPHEDEEQFHNIEIIDNIIEEQSQKNITTDTSDFDQLISSAKEALTENKIASSLMIINQALRINPDNEAALNIKQQAENELKITSVIQRAKQQIKNGNLTLPSSDNAFLTYKKLQQMLSKDDDRAIHGLKIISDKYYHFALRELKTKNTKTALLTIRTGLSVSPDHQNLNQLRINILNTQKNERLKQEKHLKEKVVKDEKQRLALLETKRQSDLQKHKEKQKQKDIAEEKTRALIRKQQNLNRLFTEADVYLEDTKLTLQSIDNAEKNLTSLERLSANSAKNLQLKLKIDNAYISLTEYQMSINDYELAQNTIKQGLEANFRNIRLKSLNDRVNILLAQKITEKQVSEKEETALPIFGTF